MRRAVILAALLPLAACKHDGDARPALQIPIEVDRPVATGCVPANMAEPPEYPDTDEALRRAPDPAERYKLLYAGRKIRVARLNEVEPIIANCPKATAK